MIEMGKYNFKLSGFYTSPDPQQDEDNRGDAKQKGYMPAPILTLESLVPSIYQCGPRP
jgi:hypothetical protein